MSNLTRGQRARRYLTFAAVLATAFLAGWSSLGVGGGAVMAVALGAGTALPIFGDDGRRDCSLRLPRRPRRLR